jgi:hypothetical protein
MASALSVGLFAIGLLTLIGVIYYMATSGPPPPQLGPK